MSFSLVSPPTPSSSISPRPISSIYDPFPIPQTKDESTWQEYLEDSSERIEGNYVKDARIIFLGDVHNEKWQNAWRRAIIERYGFNKSNKDIVLCEGIEAFKEIVYAPKALRPIDNSPFSLREKMNFYGWEDKELFRSTVKALAQWVAVYEKYNIPPSTTTWSPTDITTYKILNQQISKQTIQRNISLITTTTTVYKTLKLNQKLFVIAGSNHLFKKGKSLSDEYNILDSFSDMNACLIVPKQTLTPTIADGLQHIKRVVTTKYKASKEIETSQLKTIDSSVAIPKETDTDTSSKTTEKLQLKVSDYSSETATLTGARKKKRKGSTSSHIVFVKKTVLPIKMES